MLQVKTLIFYCFGLVGLLSALMVVLSKNSVRSVLALILTFFATAGLWVLLEAEFLSMTLVLVYVGAVMVLFLFVVMMLDIDKAQKKEGFAQYLPVGLGVAVLVMAGLIYALSAKPFSPSLFPTPNPHPQGYSQITDLGVLLYTQYLYPFELAGVLLLVAIVAAISLTWRGRRTHKTPAPHWQVSVKKADRLTVVSMAAITPDSEGPIAPENDSKTAVSDVPRTFDPNSIPNSMPDSMQSREGDS